MTPDTGKPWKYSDACKAVDTRDWDRSVVSYAPKKAAAGGFYSHHHRLLRSRGGDHSPANLVLLLGSGSTSEHGWMHKHVGTATVLGYIINAGLDPAKIPIYRINAYGTEYGWHLQHDDGQLEPCQPPSHHPQPVIVAALAAFDELKTASRLDAIKHL